VWTQEKEAALESVNSALLRTVAPDEIVVDIRPAGEAEVAEMWSFGDKKENQRWLWHAIDHHTGAVLAYVFGHHKERSFYNSEPF
jgi:insertion element IS1 protein InsB